MNSYFSFILLIIFNKTKFNRLKITLFFKYTDKFKLTLKILIKIFLNIPDKYIKYQIYFY